MIIKSLTLLDVVVFSKHIFKPGIKNEVWNDLHYITGTWSEKQFVEFIAEYWLPIT